ncbi:MAG: tetratricopeptide repeat protein [Leptospirales bacterium]
MKEFANGRPGTESIRRFSVVFSTFLLLGSVCLDGCSFLHSRSQSSVDDRNDVRFHNAMRQVQSDLKRGKLNDASRLVAIWQQYKGLTDQDRNLLEKTAGSLHSSMALYLAGKASQLERSGQFHKAREEVRKALMLEPGWDSLKKMDRHLRIRIAVRNEMGVRWKALLRRLMALKVQIPNSRKLDLTLSWAWTHLAESQYDRGRYRKARASLLQAEAYDPENDRAKKVGRAISRKLSLWIQEGEKKFRSDDLPGSLKMFQNVLRVDPSSPKALRDVSLVREAMDQGKSPLPSSLPTSPGDPGGSQ